MSATTNEILRLKPRATLNHSTAYWNALTSPRNCWSKRFPLVTYLYGLVLPQYLLRFGLIGFVIQSIDSEMTKESLSSLTI